MKECIDSLTTEPGIKGAFTRAQAAGAVPNGYRLRKIGSVPGDTHKDGAGCTILGSLASSDMVGYFVIWDDLPGIACFISGPRVEIENPN